jgi:flagellar biosynthesis/type III secretory pathway M-ring protein FliF/YscJ
MNFPKRPKTAVRLRLNKAYLIIGVVAILVLAAMLSGPLIRQRAREKARQDAAQEQTERAPGTEGSHAPSKPAQASP